MSRLGSVAVLACLTLTPQVWAQWSEPTIGPIMMSAPLTPPPVTGSTRFVDGSLGADCPSSPPGSTYSIANRNCTGNDGQAWNTVGEAAAALTAGQRTYIRAGTYTVQDLQTANSGTDGNYITFERYPGDAMPVFNCTGGTFCINGGNQFFSGTMHHVVFNGIDMHSAQEGTLGCAVGTFGAGTVDCHHIWFVNGKFHNAGPAGNDGAGFSAGPTHHIVISNSEIYDNPAAGGAVEGNHMILEFNQIYNNGRNGDDDAAFKWGGTSAASHSYVMRYNTVWNNWRASDATGACFSPGNCTGISGLYFDYTMDHLGATQSYIYNNLVFDNDQGIQAFCTVRVSIFNNLVYHNGWQTDWPRGDNGRGISVVTDDAGGGCVTAPGDFQTVNIYNNTVVGNWCNGLWLAQNNASGGTAGVHLRNNIFQENTFDNDGGCEPGEYILGLNNTTNSNADANYEVIRNTSGTRVVHIGGSNYLTLQAVKDRPGNTTLVNALDGAVAFVNEGGGDYHLTSTSIATDAGTTVALFNYALENITRPQGGAWDIGAYEFGTAAVPNAPTNLRVVSP